MRKIEQEMLRAIWGGYAWHKGNTEVLPTGQLIFVLLHGHTIAAYWEGDLHSISLAGWPTATTRSRLNAMIRETGGVRQHKGQQLLSWAGHEAPMGDSDVIVLKNWSK